MITKQVSRTAQHYAANAYFPTVFMLFWVVLTAFLTPSVVAAQKWTLYMKNDKVDCRSFKVDAGQNIYVVTNKNRVLKYDREGKFQQRFESPKFGTITILDVSNPQYVIAYYADVQAIVVLNPQLQMVKTHYLSQLGLLYGERVAMGDDGFLYVYESNPKQVVKMAFDGADLKRVSACKLLKINDLIPVQMQVQKGVLYLNVPEKGILSFDENGELLKIYGLTNVAHFKAEGRYLTYSKNHFLYTFDLSTAASSPLSMPREIEGKVMSFAENGRLYAQRGSTIEIYTAGELGVSK